MTRKETKRKPYKKYSAALKAEVVSLAERGDLSQKEVAEKFDIDPALISKWLRAKRADGDEAFRGRGNRTALEAENERLRKEVRELKLEQEILKKASAYFAKHLR